MNEYEFDLHKWVELFPIRDVSDANREPGAWEGGSLNCPSAIARVEQIRAYLESVCDLGPRVPADVFLFAKGEPPRRDVTKIGGLPYRPRGIPWPTTRFGPMTFLAQYCFTESKDIVPDLPGDVLLLFVTESGLYSDREEPRYFQFEWYRSGIPDLIEASEMPPPLMLPGTKDFNEDMRAALSQILPDFAARIPIGTAEHPWIIPNCYGVKHRTWDYVDMEGGMSQLKKHIPSFHEIEEPFRRDAFGTILRLNGWKIGGLPFWAKPGNLDESLKGMPLCSLTDCIPPIEAPYPWLNVQEAISFAESIKEPILQWYDGGCLVNFSIDERGVIDWQAELS